MRLEVGSFPVCRAEIGERTSYADGLLTVGHEAVRRLVLRDPRIRHVTLELLHPGESVRVLRALDAIEPLVKARGPGSAFPGFNGPPVTGGSGRSHRLEGFAVVEVTDFPFPASGVQAFEEGIVEMSGPGAAYSGCADRVCLCLVFTPGTASSNADYDDAVRRAALRVAEHLAGATRALPPPRVEIFAREPAPGLPRVVWVHQIRAQGPMVQSFLYGHELDGMVPTILDPNELLDGALVGGELQDGEQDADLHAHAPPLAHEPSRPPRAGGGLRGRDRCPRPSRERVPETAVCLFRGEAGGDAPRGGGPLHL